MNTPTTPLSNGDDHRFVTSWKPGKPDHNTQHCEHCGKTFAELVQIERLEAALEERRQTKRMVRNHEINGLQYLAIEKNWWDRRQAKLTAALKAAKAAKEPE